MPSKLAKIIVKIIKNTPLADVYQAYFYNLLIQRKYDVKFLNLIKRELS